MPRYTVGSLEEALWSDFKEMMALEEGDVHGKVQQMPDNEPYVIEEISGRNRHEEKVAEGVVGFTRYYEHGYITRPNFLRVIRDLVKE